MNSVLRLTPLQRAELYRAASQKLGFGEVIVEKDFWVCWMLHQLFTLPGIGEHLIFKGGTSLSKVWKAIARFSEDIDVSLSRDWLGFTGSRDPENAISGKKQRAGIENLAAACAEKINAEILPALRTRAAGVLGPDGWTIAIDADDPQTLHFKYPSTLGEDSPQAYVRREVKIEFGARSDAWPAEEKTILPYVAEVYPDTITDSGVAIKVLSIERTFWEKATILHAEAHREESKATPTRFSRHYADLAALADHANAADALGRDDLRARVVEHKQVFFAAGWAKYSTAVPGTFRLVPPDYRLATLQDDYRAMQEMFFGRPRAWAEIVERLRTLEAAINRRESKS
ncbi:hypothetical protein OPIT5_06055 [Opitutaceae bacterium TAV5]|nr:hypothetical protein OPIT5_06055 [Opitutaceae bacterium TAV5]